MQLRAIVTGSGGILADSLQPLLIENGYAVCATDIVASKDIALLDIRNLEDVIHCVTTYRPDIIFHLAAETDVDKCELNPAHGYETNVKGAQNIAVACKTLDIPMVYISTGSVFDGKKTTGYTEMDKPNPVSVYGISKLKGEEIVASTLTKYYIIRAGWMIGRYHKDKKFVGKILQLLKTKKEIPVVTDKIGSPTFTKDFSQGILGIVTGCAYGLYHCVNKGICTRFDIAEKIKEYVRADDVTLRPVTSDFFPLPAPRPASEALLNHKLSLLGLDTMRPWQDALKEYIEEMRTA